MDLTLTEEQELIRSTARELLSAEAGVANARAMGEDARGYSQELWGEMVELGWTGLALSEDHGGVGMGFLELCLLIEELGAHQVPSPFVTTAVHCALAIERFGTDEQKEAYLPAVAAGERVMAYGCVGPGGRWDPADVGLTATPKGDGYALDGEVLFVPYAHVADDLLVLARREGGDPTAFLVDADASGVSTDELQTTGNDRQFRVTFSGVEVPEEGVLGGPDEGSSVAESVAAYAAAALCAEMVGGAQRVLDMTVSYAGDREQFGSPVGSFQAVQHHCANMAMDVLGARFMAYEAIWRLGEGLEASEEISLAKSWVSEAYRRVCGLAHQVHGAIGFTEEFDLHYYFRHATDAELTFGDAGYHRELVAERLGV